ncbi:FAD-dependent oxidoreductase [Sciscionella sediminilitoris]|uniref:FAD-dependent oxidoreductase n=1 Tax=Sciscionella sediminilitoris TaxID=1445613 RepID=UPI0004DF4E41|nr:FAD-dependent oxidoreductase [Sciscionella sp. SE31]
MAPVQQIRVGVVGVGTMGSQVLRRLAMRGIEATGFERFELGHDRGAAGGQTRIFRIAYKEGGRYVPLLRAARSAWLELEERTGQRLFEPYGALTVGSAGDPDVRTVLDVARQWSVDGELVEESAYPQHRLFEGDLAFLDREGGLLHPARAVRAASSCALEAGARVHTGTYVEEVGESRNGVAVHYRREGQRHTEHFDQVIVCTGPWIGEAFPMLRRAVEVRRAVLCWFSGAEPGYWAPQRFPVGMRRSGGENRFSFFPDVGDGVKINLHVEKSTVPDPERLDPVVDTDYLQRVTRAVTRCLPGLRAEPLSVRTYMEGYTEDNHGIIGRVPGSPNILAMGGFSGHGFKLSPVFAEAAADLVCEGRTEWPVEHLGIERIAA